jgi:GNAT superfamily N-acetyltransferase
MNIRPGNITDSKAIAELIESFQSSLTLDPSGAGAEHFLASVSEASERQYLESPRYRYWIAELDGELTGFIAMRDQSHLFHLFVAAEQHRKGIAATLWCCARDQAIRAGGVSEFTVNSSLNAVPVYKRFGFVPAGEPVQMHGIAFLPMRLNLRA